MMPSDGLFGHRRMRRFATVAGVVAVAMTVGPPARSAVVAAGFHPGRYAYVANSGKNTLTVISAATDAVVGVIGVGSHPRSVAVSPDGARAYVANFADGQAAGSVSVVDTRAGRVVASVRVGIGPVGVAVSRDGARAYVANRGNGFSETSILSVINTRTETVIQTVQVGGEAAGVALSADGTKAYVSNTFGYLSVIGLTSAKRGVIQVGPRACCSPSVVTVAPTGGRGYVTSAAPDLSNAQVLSVFDTATDKVVALAARLPPIGEKGIAISPNSRRVYASSGTGDILVIDSRDNRVLRTLPVGATPAALVVAPSGLRLFVVTGATNTVAVVDLLTGLVVDTIPVGADPRGIAFGTLAPITPIAQWR
jgi:YVTN family beta-propeller protein